MTALDWNARVAQVAHELLDPGPMSHVLRKQAYRDFIAANFDDSASAPVYSSGGTNCAIFVRGCLTQAGVMPRGARPEVTAITTWLGVPGFTEAPRGSWVPVEQLGEDGSGLLPGDVLYWAGYRGMTRAQWLSATNGHVGLVVFDGEGWMRPTAEGGGSGHLCRKSDGPKDVRLSHNRPLRGVWRPNLMTTEKPT